MILPKASEGADEPGFAVVVLRGCGVRVAALTGASARAQDLGAEIVQAERESLARDRIPTQHPPTANDPLSIDPDLAIWTLIVFVVLLVVLRKFAWGPIIGGLGKRESTIADHIAEAERNHDEAKRLLAQYEQKLAEAAGRGARADGAGPPRSRAGPAGDPGRGQAGADAERTRALHDIEAAADQAMESLAERSAQLAVELAGKILKTQAHQRRITTRLIQEAMAKFPKASVN